MAKVNVSKGASNAGKGIGKKLKELWEKSSSPPGAGSPLHIILFILNIVFSGVGTIILAIMKKDGMLLVVGLLQLLFIWAIVGWIWSIYTGWMIFTKG